MPLVLLSTLPLLCVSKMQVSSFHHCLLICSLITRRTNVEPPQGSFADFSLSLPPLPPSLSSLPLSSSLHGAPIIAAVLFRHNRPHWPCNGYAELSLFPPQGRVQIENGALSIAALNLSDSGMYQCVAENKHGIIYSSAQLMVLGKNCIPPSAFILLICLCVWSSPKIKKKKKQPSSLPAKALLSDQSAHSFDVTMGSSSRNMNLMECLILLSMVFAVLIWILQTHFFAASCVAFSCRWGIDFICKALMTSTWPGSVRNSILSWFIRWHLGLQMMADNCDHSRSGARVRGRFSVCNSGAAGGSVALSPIGISAESTLRFWAATAAEAEGESISAQRGWSARGFGLSLFLISRLFSLSLPTHSFTSQLRQKSIKSRAKSSLRQRGHSRMQASGLAPSN